mmetsp:Transcript_22517/g.53247  ORF Transcript_22517/g.53247 Transcript_22517/m.53247 type:complete len:91 (+) Transcript_22517:84-356(+)
MWPPCQEEWKHEVPVEADKRLVVHPLSGLTRVNLTFRMRRDDYVKKAPRCTCDRTCRLKPVFKQGDNCGRYFWACFGRAGETCEFFQWDS